MNTYCGTCLIQFREMINLEYSWTTPKSSHDMMKYVGKCPKSVRHRTQPKS